MRRIVLAALFIAAACSKHDLPAPAATENAAPAATAGTETVPMAPPAPASPTTFAPLPGPADKDPQALLAYWQAAVEADDQSAAARAWRSGIAPATTPSGNGPARVTFGDRQTEGAAGSSYFTVPVTITVDGPGGEPIATEGTLTARRVNDVDGASAEQLSWRIVAIDWR